jgi:hypothetical protein
VCEQQSEFPPKIGVTLPQLHVSSERDQWPHRARRLGFVRYASCPLCVAWLFLCPFLAEFSNEKNEKKKKTHLQILGGKKKINKQERENEKGKKIGGN